MNSALLKEPSFFNDLQEQLTLLWEDSNNLFSDTWRINGQPLFIAGQCKLLSNDAPYFKAKDINAELAIKLILIKSIDKGLTHSAMKLRLDFSVLMFAYMETQQISMIDKEDVTGIFAFYLMHKTSVDGRRNSLTKEPKIIRRLSPRSGLHSSTITLILQQVLQALRLQGIDVSTPAVRDLPEKKSKNMLKEAIEQISLGDLTYQDWLKGGSFNNLTLDHGRHYIEYLLDFYDENHAIAKTLEDVDRKALTIGAKFGLTSEPEIRHIFRKLLLRDYEDKRLKELSMEKLPKLKAAVENEYQKSIRPILIQQFILRDQTVARIGKMIGIVFDEDRSSHIVQHDRLRNLLFFVLNDREYPELDRIIKHSNFKTTKSELREIIAEIAKEVPQASVPPKGYIEKFTKEYFGTSVNSEINTFILNVRHAGICCVAAFTGWRRSEFGFTLPSINNIINHDTLDQYALPYRHQIKWNVFKTQKGALSQREITQKTFELILSLSGFHRPGKKEPAIYSKGNKSLKRDISGEEVSGQKIDSAATANWYNFVTYYKPFVALREINEYESLIQRKDLSDTQALRLAELSIKKESPEWQYALNNSHLNETFNLVQQELPVVSYKHLGGWTALYNNSLNQYRKHLIGEQADLHPSILTMFEERLPEAIKQEIIKSTDDLEELRDEVNSFLYSDLTYPTPHAFRHMWAEAVFRRFDGDAGWMIRSNFKHITESMWLAYIADKATMRGLEQLKLSISSTIMKNWLRNKGNRTAGKYHKFLKRLFSNTTIASYQDAETLIDKIASEDVISIKANPWGYCINRLSTSSLAKCATDGEAKPRNASPHLCMGCINFMTCDANVDYIIEHSWQHVDLLNSEHLASIPQVLVEPSMNYVALARKRISEIEPGHRILDKFDQALANAAQEKSNGLL